MPEFQSFTLQAYTRPTLTARVIYHYATVSSNPDLKYESIFPPILLLVLTVAVAIYHDLYNPFLRFFSQLADL